MLEREREEKRGRAQKRVNMRKKGREGRKEDSKRGREREGGREECLRKLKDDLLPLFVHQEYNNK